MLIIKGNHNFRDMVDGNYSEKDKRPEMFYTKLNDYRSVKKVTSMLLDNHIEFEIDCRTISYGKPLDELTNKEDLFLFVSQLILNGWIGKFNFHNDLSELTMDIEKAFKDIDIKGK